uniref:mucin-2-like n=1 Tax=Pristiophorus japonicus TaxID=55135 RepID=UPI00398F4CDE
MATSSTEERYCVGDDWDDFIETTEKLCHEGMVGTGFGRQTQSSSPDGDVSATRFTREYSNIKNGMEEPIHRFVPRSLQETITTLDGSNGFCSTWGNGAFRTFDDKFYHFTSTCNYILSRQCTGGTEDFNIQIRRGSNGNLEHIYIQIEGIKILLVNGTISVQDAIVTVPFDDKVISIQTYGIYTRIYNRKHTISLIWNHQDALSLTLDTKYQGHLCGLCGKFEEDNIITYDSIFFDRNKLDVLGHICYSNPPTGSSCAENTKCAEISKFFTSCFDDLQLVEKYWQMCKADVCACKELKCACATFAEIARQCDKETVEWWNNWRTGTECGTVLDNVRGTNSCIQKAECACEYGGKIYESGETRTTSCQSCTCETGAWSCSHLSCPGRCKIEEATYITTFDNKYYTMIGDCSYYAVFTEDWTIKVELRQCQAAFKQTCLQRVTLTKNLTSYVFSNDGNVYFDGNKLAMPLRTGGIIIFRQSSMYIQVSTTFGLKMQVQISTVMQLYISLSEDLKGSTKGLCGVFNDDAEDDFLSAQGIVESTPITLANSWKIEDSCPDTTIPSPCVSSENEKYAKDYCHYLKDATGAFSVCHSTVDYILYYEMCVAATCGCENIEDCLCAGLGAYVHACAANGIIVRNWRRDICNKPCANNQVFENDMRACKRTCRSLSEYDYTCGVQDVPVYGCGCPEGKYMDNTGACIDKSDCPCYIGELVIKKGQSITLDGKTCTCENGKPYCSTVPTTTSPVCLNRKVYFDCRNAEILCAKTCRGQNMPCSNTQCVPGCVCPDDLVEDDSGRCIAPEQCPCLFGGESHAPGSTIQRDCNKCTCQGGSWSCTKNPCPKTCLVYGDGHYVTFDGKRYRYDGNCEYILVEDRCNQENSTLQIIIESVPCCENGVTCSRNIRILLEGKEFNLIDGRVVRAEKSYGQTQCTDDSYSLHTVGLYLILTFSNGITVIWDKRTRVSITLDPRWKNKICGLCGNFNGDVADELTTKGNSLVTSTLEFGNSWKSSLSCSDTLNQTFPCDRNPYCLAWAQRKCSIMKDAVFQKCHKKVDPTPFYDACVEEACSCDLEGKYLGFCTAVAVYAEACNKADVCIRWRTPDLCPVYCDYYNNPDECSWHYHPCGTLTTKTCSDHYIGKKFSAILEGCYAKCPVSAPYLDENIMKCVTLPDCTCYYNGEILQPGEVTRNDCEECECNSGNVTCRRIPEDTTTSSTTGITTTVKATTTRSTTGSTPEVTTTTKGATTTTLSTGSSTTEGITTTVKATTTGPTTGSTPVTTTTKGTTTTSNIAGSTTTGITTTVKATTTGSTTGSTPELTTTTKGATTTTQSTGSSTTEGIITTVTATTTGSTTGSTPVTTTTKGTTTTPVIAYTTTTEGISTTLKATTTGSTTGSTPVTTTTKGTTTTPNIAGSTTTGITTTVKATTGSTPEVTTTTKGTTTTTNIAGTTTTEGISTTVKATTAGSATGSTLEVTTTTRVPTTTTLSTGSSTTEVVCHGEWSRWFNEHTPSSDSPGDYELLDPRNNKHCSSPFDQITIIHCQFVDEPERPISDSPDNVTCDKDTGLTCIVSENDLQESKFCYDYQIRVCCEKQTAMTTTTSSTNMVSVTTTTKGTTTTPNIAGTTTTEGITTVKATTTGSTTGSTPEVTTTTKGATTTTLSSGSSTTEGITTTVKATTTGSTTGSTPVTTTTKGTTTIPNIAGSTTTESITTVKATTTGSTTGSTPEVTTTTKGATTTSLSTGSSTTEGITTTVKATTTGSTTGSTPEVTTTTKGTTTTTLFTGSSTTEGISTTVTATTTGPTTGSTPATTTTKGTTTTPVIAYTTTTEGISTTLKATTTGSTTGSTPVTTTTKGTTTTPNIAGSTTSEGISTTVKATTAGSATGSTLEVTTTTRVPTTTTLSTGSSTTEVVCHGEWSRWFNEHTPSSDSPGDYELLDPRNNKHCSSPFDQITIIHCQFVDEPERPISDSPDNVTCDKDTGLTCIVSENDLQESKFCYDYQIRVCCEKQTAMTTTTSSTNMVSVTTTTKGTTTTPNIAGSTTTGITTVKTTTGSTPEVTTTTKGATTTTLSSGSSTTEGITTTVKATTTGSTTGSTPVTTTTKGTTTTPNIAGSTTTESITTVKATTTGSTTGSTPEVTTTTKGATTTSLSTGSSTTAGITTTVKATTTGSTTGSTLVTTTTKGTTATSIIADTTTTEGTTTTVKATTTGSTAGSTPVATTTKGTTTTPIIADTTTTEGITTTVKATTTGSTTGSTPEVTTTTKGTTTTTLFTGSSTTEGISTTATATTTGPTTGSTPATTTTKGTTTTPVIAYTTTTEGISTTLKATTTGSTTGSTPVTTTTKGTTTTPNIAGSTTTEGISTTVKATTAGSATGSTLEVTTTTRVPTTTTLSTGSSTTEVVCHGEWSRWFNEHTPSSDSPGDYELLDPRNNKHCSSPFDQITIIHCQFVDEPERPISDSPDNVTCDKDTGLTCIVSENDLQESKFCYDYQIRVCCEKQTAMTTTTSSTNMVSVTTTTKGTTTTPNIAGSTTTGITTVKTTTGSTTEVTTTTKGATTTTLSSGSSTTEGITTTVKATTTGSTTGSTPVTTTTKGTTTTPNIAGSTTTESITTVKATTTGSTTGSTPEVTTTTKGATTTSLSTGSSTTAGITTTVKATTTGSTTGSTLVTTTTKGTTATSIIADTTTTEGTTTTVKATTTGSTAGSTPVATTTKGTTTTPIIADTTTTEGITTTVKATTTGSTTGSTPEVTTTTKGTTTTTLFTGSSTTEGISTTATATTTGPTTGSTPATTTTKGTTTTPVIAYTTTTEGISTTLKATTTGSTTGSTPVTTTTKGTTTTPNIAGSTTTEGISTTVKATTAGSATGSTLEVTTTTRVPTTTTLSTGSSTTEVVCHGEWSRWFNEHTPSSDSPGDYELLDPRNNKHCSSPFDQITIIHCQFVDEPERPISDSPDNVTCDKDTGLTCIVSENDLQESKFCYDYQIRVCCEKQTAMTTTTSSTNMVSVTTTTKGTTTTPNIAGTTTTEVTTTTKGATTTTLSSGSSTTEGITTTVKATTTGSTTGSTPVTTTTKGTTTTPNIAGSTTTESITTVKATTTGSTTGSTPGE